MCVQKPPASVWTGPSPAPLFPPFSTPSLSPGHLVSCALLLLWFSHSVVSDSLGPHGLQHVRLPCPSPSPGACSNSSPLSRVMPSNYLILCRPLLLLPSVFSSLRVFSSESVLRIRWPEYRRFSFSISPSNEHSVDFLHDGLWFMASAPWSCSKAPGMLPGTQTAYKYWFLN